MPLSVLRKQLDGMAASKFNVMHWHVHDSGAWSLESESLPGLADAAVNPGWQYSHAEVKDLVSYARDRGIRVIPEFEPGARQRAVQGSAGDGDPMLRGLPADE